MDCREARAGLWPPERPRLVGDEVVEARAHVQDCADCATYFAQDRAILDLYDRARQTPAPSSVRERVYDALASARTVVRLGHPSREAASRSTAVTRATTALRSRVVLAALATVATVATIAFFASGDLRSDPAPTEHANMFVEDYLRRAVGQDHIETTDPTEVTRFLERELGIRVEPLRLAGLELSRVEICLLEGRRGAMIVYKKDGAVVSHYLVPREGATGRAPALSAPRGSDNAAEMPVVTWATPRLEQALVGEVLSEELLEMAKQGSSVH